jgi:hypothetical protein
MNISHGPVRPGLDSEAWQHLLCCPLMSRRPQHMGLLLKSTLPAAGLCQGVHGSCAGHLPPAAEAAHTGSKLLQDHR